MRNIYIIGDIHGKFQPIRSLAEMDITNKGDIVIQLGDFGGNFFFNERDKDFKEKLRKYNLTFFIIRGNHEERPSICAEISPDKWTTENYFGNTVWVEKEYPFIKYALDYPAEYNINGYSTLILPGAYSVDKYYRLQQGWSWFQNEMLTPAEMKIGFDLVNKTKRYDLVLSHTCPTIYEPTDLFLSTVDQSTVDKSMERFLGQIEWELDYQLWCWGHFHQTRVYPKVDSHRQRLMLFNNAVLDLNKYFQTKHIYHSLITLI